MATFKEFSAEDIKTSKAFLNQLVDILHSDISSSISRRKYQVWVTGGVGPGVTSSLFQTVYDQDFTLQTANPVFDITIGLHRSSSVLGNAGTEYTIDANGNLFFVSQSLMMREKINLYRQFAATLLGDANARFSFQEGSTTNYINEALFICFRRLFARDQIKRETFAIQLFTSASTIKTASYSAGNSKIYTDIGSSVNKEITFGGNISAIVDSSDTTKQVGILFIDRGVLVMDMKKVFSQVNSAGGNLAGSIKAVSPGGTENFNGTFNQFLFSASIDDILDHICVAHFSSSAQTAITFQNITNINSTLFFCRASADEFNYSSNPTYIDSDNRIIVIDPGQEETQRSFTFITSIGLYDANDNLLAVAKLSRPVLKDDSRDLTFRVRLDF